MKITPDCSTIMKLAETYSIVPMVFLTYVNPIFIYGKERFMKKCTECGIDGIIVPDMPYEEREELAPACEKYGVDIIPLIAPTSNDRIAMIAKKAKAKVSDGAIVKIIAKYGEDCVPYVAEYVKKMKEAVDRAAQ